MVIDCHTHLDTSDPQAAEHLLASMDATAIDVSLIIAETSETDTTNVEGLLKAAALSKRIKVITNFIYAHAQDVAYVNDLTASLANDHIVGLKFYLGYEHYSPLDPVLFPLYEYCQSKQVPIMFHTGVLETGSRGLLKYTHPLLIDEVATHFPKLTIVMAHMGNPWLIDCAAVLAKNPNVYADVSAFFEENKPITAEDITIFALRMQEVKVFLGSFSKFLFGSDWPLYSQSEYVAAMEALMMNDTEREQVMGGTAQRLFHLK